jgi:P-type Cu2+ transporter
VALLLSLPVIVYSFSIFFSAAIAALWARTLDMMVLVAVAVSAGWLYSVGVTLSGGGQVRFEAATILAAFVLLVHGFEKGPAAVPMTPSAACSTWPPPRATVIRDGEPVEIPTAEVVVGDLLLVRRGSKIPVDAVVEEGESDVDASPWSPARACRAQGAGRSGHRGAINTDGTLRVRATKVGADTALAQIVQLVQEAQNSNAPRSAPGRPGRLLARPLVALVRRLTTFLVRLAFRPVDEALLCAITVDVTPAPTPSAWPPPTAIMVGTGLGPSEACCSRTPWLSRRPPTSRWW